MTETLRDEIETRIREQRRGCVDYSFSSSVSGRIQSMNPDGSDRKVIVTHCRLPDGIAVDVEAGHIYWTNMGSIPSANDGSIERADIDGKEPQGLGSAGWSRSRQSRSTSIRRTANS